MIELRTIIHHDKEYELYVDTDSFQLTTDSVLLAEFLTPKKSDKLLVDFGTGHGDLLFLLNATCSLKMIGIEMQDSISKLAEKSIYHNGIEKEIKIIHDKIQNIGSYLKPNSTDIVITNPPYFKETASFLKSEKKAKATARHELEISFKELAKYANLILKNKGRFVFIQRTERLIEIIKILKENHLEPKKIQFVHYQNNKNSAVFLMEARKNGGTTLQVMPPLFINERTK